MTTQAFDWNGLETSFRSDPNLVYLHIRSLLWQGDRDHALKMAEAVQFDFTHICALTGTTLLQDTQEASDDLVMDRWEVLAILRARTEVKAEVVTPPTSESRCCGPAAARKYPLRVLANHHWLLPAVGGVCTLSAALVVLLKLRASPSKQ